MRSELTASLRPAAVLLILFSLVLGLAYPAALTGLSQISMPRQANGSLIRDGDRVIGSELIAQNFASPRYFQPRPSAAGKGYDAAASAATNLAPGSKDLRDAIATRMADARAKGMTGVSVPPDLVTTSASGLDPDLSPEAAFSQTARVATARGLPDEQVRALVERSIAYPLFGIIGERRVNVLLLNRQLDRIAPNATP
ncbi:potassium-transporting ATPase KdpC subunit [Polymorphobacter multimanifer]|uniref:Potassium-transporting ATPase KdpC subunit n=1 Tax=Polymorphobacter multimanifer TaxID=1070431 RepID=A0A841L183_9SPHN|nr:potassium-transporting ATPase subunit KdpC [Polymorphobacter multimanifer]MBB6226086.1 K+-transporting ATPase ATPase C chain [Polymorphobacter multimanifer]GGI76275.1 potassium-transporting ATPase KdpC subunit [Polymorphobacter multimanifer]